ncbi:tyrosine-type recombinase/integrase [Methylobacterium sp. WL12]|uniref:tyrosine-type recombinase/integrase n=1 Tax=Methylobacterium sp. WL12 TaxID=2603890 RepID=UPI0011CB60A1|nr:site-specific integrase [Methylobacterium sp. WL12]TXM65684.1 tyrosine-type recombinase/integrase [Methylobacterium sp. WL12]
MPARILTDVEVRSLKPEPSGRLMIYDAKARGLCLRVSAGTKAWSFVYRPRGSAQQRRFTIGDYPAWSLSQAREKALALRRLVQDGGDPVVAAKERSEALTVAGLIARFIEWHAKVKLRSWRDYESLLSRDVVPVLGRRLAHELTRGEVANLIDKIALRAPVVSNRNLQTLSSVYSWAVSEGLVPSNPVIGLKQRHTEVPKERVLSDAEIAAFWTASAAAAPSYRDAFRLILLTGQRPGECAGILAEEVDPVKATWTLPAARTKNKRPHAIPLVGEALAIARRLRSETPSGRLILSPRGKPLSPQNMAKAFERLREGIFDEGATPHDLRRTAATVLGRLEIDRMTIAYVLNHASTTKSTVTGSTYDQYTYMPQKKRALEALDAEIRYVISGVPRPDNVTVLKVGA